jgi:hypothetical protein
MGYVGQLPGVLSLVPVGSAGGGAQLPRQAAANLLAGLEAVLLLLAVPAPNKDAALQQQQQQQLAANQAKLLQIGLLQVGSRMLRCTTGQGPGSCCSCCMLHAMFLRMPTNAGACDLALSGKRNGWRF